MRTAASRDVQRLFSSWWFRGQIPPPWFFGPWTRARTRAGFTLLRCTACSPLVFLEPNRFVRNASRPAPDIVPLCTHLLLLVLCAKERAVFEQAASPTCGVCSVSGKRTYATAAEPLTSSYVAESPCTVSARNMHDRFRLHARVRLHRGSSRDLLQRFHAARGTLTRDQVAPSARFSRSVRAKHGPAMCTGRPTHDISVPVNTFKAPLRRRCPPIAMERRPRWTWRKLVSR